MRTRFGSPSSQSANRAAVSREHGVTNASIVEIDDDRRPKPVQENRRVNVDSSHDHVTRGRAQNSARDFAGERYVASHPDPVISSTPIPGSSTGRRHGSRTRQQPVRSQRLASLGRGSGGRDARVGLLGFSLWHAGREMSRGGPSARSPKPSSGWSRSRGRTPQFGPRLRPDPAGSSCETCASVASARECGPSELQRPGAPLGGCFLLRLRMRAYASKSAIVKPISSSLPCPRCSALRGTRDVYDHEPKGCYFEWG